MGSSAIAPLGCRVVGRWEEVGTLTCRLIRLPAESVRPATELPALFTRLLAPFESRLLVPLAVEESTSPAPAYGTWLAEAETKKGGVGLRRPDGSPESRRRELQRERTQSQRRRLMARESHQREQGRRSQAGGLQEQINLQG